MGAPRCDHSRVQQRAFFPHAGRTVSVLNPVVVSDIIIPRTFGWEGEENERGRVAMLPNNSTPAKEHRGKRLRELVVGGACRSILPPWLGVTYVVRDC